MTVDNGNDLAVGYLGHAEPTRVQISARKQGDNVSSSSSTFDTTNELGAAIWDARQIGGDEESEAGILQTRTYAVSHDIQPEPLPGHHHQARGARLGRHL